METSSRDSFNPHYNICTKTQVSIELNADAARTIAEKNGCLKAGPALFAFAIRRFVPYLSIRPNAFGLAILLALGACGSRGGTAGGTGAQADEAAGNLGEEAGVDTARLEARAGIALQRALAETPVRFAHVRSGYNGAICGEVETEPSTTAGSGLRPFLVNQEGEAFVSSGPGLQLQNPTDPFPDLYVQWCATPQELQSVRQQLQRMRPEDVVVPPSPQVNVEAALPPPAESSVPSPEPAPRVARQPSGDDTFYNSVVRPQPDE